MAGKFINSTYTDNFEAISNSMKDLNKNTFQYLTEQMPTETTYYNVILDHTHVGEEDDPAGLSNNYVGEESAFRFNKIESFPIVGMDKIIIELDGLNEEGPDLNEISGEAIVYPNTITPYPGDHFVIPRLQETYLFRVDEVQKGTVENGGNYYRISYRVVTACNDVPDYQVMGHSKFIMDNLGTGLNTIVTVKSFDKITRIDDLLMRFRIYYKELFYSTAVQCMIFDNYGLKCYDMYLTEFLKNTGVCISKSDYVYLGQQLQPSPTFNINYEKTLFYCIETKNKRKLGKIVTELVAEIINDLSSIFYIRYEDYYSMKYDGSLNGRFEQPYIVHSFKNELVTHIIENKLMDDKYLLDNIIIKYFNDIDITDEDITRLEDIDFFDCQELYYYLPVVMFILEYYAKKLMKK